jgi:hypothetical protein
VLLKWLGNRSETCRKNCPLKGLAPVFGVEPIKRSRFNEVQIIGILRQAEAGVRVVDLCC